MKLVLLYTTCIIANIIAATIPTYAETASATQRILPQECMYTVVNPETQELYFHNPEICDPQPPAPEPTPGQTTEQPSSPTDSRSVPNETEDVQEVPTGSVTDPNNPPGGAETPPGKISTALNAFLARSTEIILYMIWILSWMAAVVLTVILLVLVAFGGAGVSKLIAVTSSSVRRLQHPGR